MSDSQKAIRKSIAAIAPQLEKLASNLHAAPELGFEETKACKWQTDLLKKLGFKVQSPFAKLPTAFKATAGRGGPVLCIMSEYDALPEIGHACGHNLIAATALGAGKALADVLKAEKIPGTVIVMGTPGEESKGGKVYIVQRGGLDGVDAAMSTHPSWRTIGDCGSNGIQRYLVTFTGLAAHAAADPENGLNALDAIMLMFHGINAWRQQLPETSRIHGIVRDGGAAPNIIPETASAEFYVRSPDNAFLKKMCKRFCNIAKGAALMTGTKVEIDETDLPYAARKVNKTLDEAFLEAAASAGLNPVQWETPGRASSDFGDVSLVVPGIHPYFAIAKKQIACHSIEFAEAAGSAFGRKQMLKAAESLAQVGYRFFTDEAFRKQVSAEFKKK